MAETGPAALEARQRRAERLGHNLAAPAALVQRLTFGWSWGGRAEAAALNQLYAAADTQIQVCRALWEALRVGLISKPKRHYTRRVVAAERELRDQDAQQVDWAQVANRRNELTALRDEAADLFNDLVIEKVKQQGAASGADVDAVEARRRDAFRAYAGTLPAGLFGGSVTHFGSANNFADVLEAARAAGAPAAFMTPFLQACQAQNWQILGRIQAYFGRLAGRSAADFTDSLARALQFVAAGNVGVGGGARADFAGGGGGHVALPGQTYPFNFNPGWLARKFGSVARATNVIVAQGDLDHWRCGHTFEDFRLTQAKAGRAPFSSMWPQGTGNGAILADVAIAVGNLAAPIRAQIDNTADRFELDTQAGGFTYHVGINNVSGGANNLYRMVQFYPTAGGLSIPQAVLRSIISLFGG